MQADPLDPSRADERRDLFGGSGVVRVWSLGAVTPPFTAVLYCELEARGLVGVHRQEHDDEVVVFVEGSGVVSVNRVGHPCGPGSAVALPLGALLSIENTSDAPLRYLIVKARQQAEPSAR